MRRIHNTISPSAGVNQRTTALSTADELSHAAAVTAVQRHNLAESRRATRMQQLDDELEHTASVVTNQAGLLQDTLERLRQIARTDLPHDEWLYAARRHDETSRLNNPNVSRPF